MSTEAECRIRQSETAMLEEAEESLIHHQQDENRMRTQAEQVISQIRLQAESMLMESEVKTEVTKQGIAQLEARLQAAEQREHDTEQKMMVMMQDRVANKFPYPFEFLFLFKYLFKFQCRLDHLYNINQEEN